MKLTVLFAALAAFTFSSCFSTNMKVEATPVEGVNYSAYKTYEWVPLDSKALENFTEKDKAVRAAFVAEADGIMSRAGLSKQSSGKPDLYVYVRGVRMPGYRAVGKSPSYESRYLPSGAGAIWLDGTAYMGEGYLKAGTQTAVRFLISEPESDKAVWRGKADVKIDDSRSEALLLSDVRTLARKLLKGFPPNKR